MEGTAVQERVGFTDLLMDRFQWSEDEVLVT
jgi:hypothetical protein